MHVSNNDRAVVTRGARRACRWVGKKSFAPFKAQYHRRFRRINRYLLNTNGEDYETYYDLTRFDDRDIC